MFITEQHERKNGITTPIFPDEIDEDSETSSEYSADAESSPSTSNQGQGNMLMALNEWKKKTELFSQCTNLICDPFGQFIPHERVICVPCKEIIRDELFDKLVICWPEEELLELLTNYIYFHAVKILEADAERNYAVNNNKSTNPHFLAYIEFRRDKAMVLTNFAAAFDFPADLLLSANRSHMTSKHTTSRKELTAMGFAARCKLCRRDQIAVDSTKNYDVFTLSGHRYKHNFEMLKGEETDEPEQFVLCPVHVVYFKSFYHLIHMDWNVHWNCQFRIMQVKQKKPSLDADELIKAVDLEAFKVPCLDRRTLANFYIQHLKKLDKYGYYEHILNYCHAVDTTGVKKWLRIKTQIKEEELFKQTLDQMR